MVPTLGFPNLVFRSEGLEPREVSSVLIVVIPLKSEFEGFWDFFYEVLGFFILSFRSDPDQN